jgi:hypothetical protein
MVRIDKTILSLADQLYYLVSELSWLLQLIT